MLLLLSLMPSGAPRICRHTHCPLWDGQRVHEPYTETWASELCLILGRAQCQAYLCQT